MSLRETINNDLKEAMKSKDAKKRDSLRLLTSAFKQIEVDERKELNDVDVVQIIRSQIKRRNASADQYKEAGRDDLMQIELDEIAYYSVYLPKELDSEELAFIVHDIIVDVGAKGMKDMGKVMGVATKKLAGKVSNNRISECVKKLLSEFSC
jgi:uncharacterized protein YqeY